MSGAFDRLQGLLIELFQLDAAGDLDFGVYRIMNYKRFEIEAFIHESLPAIVDDALKSGAAARESGLATQLEEKAAEIRKNFGEEAISPDGEIDSRWEDTPAGREYVDLRSSAAGATGHEEMKATVFNHLYTFFSRYYEGGDFLSRRRYSRRQKYAIPYNGEEVYLHWANADQYYVKTGQSFTDYHYKAPNGVAVHFKLVAASVEQNNNKGDHKYFVPRTGEATYDPAVRALTVHFEHRPLTGKEEGEYGPKNERQKRINDDAVSGLIEKFKSETEALAAITDVKGRDSDDKPVGYLDHHLRRYVRGNTQDFFVHKDLKGFLEGELDFYLKNEVLNLDDLDGSNESRAEGWFELMRAMKRIGRGLIAFLAQIEDYQKRLFEKKKFVARADYCMTLDNVPEDLYPEILQNDAQFAEWERLFEISAIEGTVLNGGGEVNEQWLRDNPYLVLDTNLFGEDFKDRLLGSIEDLDERTDGLLIQSENFQALNLLQDRYREQVKCIYIDPPFNTGDDGFLYKDNYQHSSWLAMMRSRLESLHNLLGSSGSLFAHIDDNELGYLLGLTDGVFDRNNQVSVVSFKQSSVSGPKAMNPGLANISSFILWYAKDKRQWASYRAYVPSKRDDRYNSYIINRSEHHSEWKLTTLRNAFAESVGVPVKQLRKHFGDYLEEELEKFVLEAPEKVVRLARVVPKDVNATAREQLLRSKDHPDIIHRVPREDREDYYFQNGQQLIFYSSKVQELDGERVTVEPASTLWTDLLSNNIHAEGGVAFENGKKPVALLKRITALSARPGDLILDSFAGSGTTGHAVINLNREDGGNRKYILTEMGEYFDTVLKPRIQKVIYSKDWKEGNPVSREGTSHVFKYLSLEQYEDTLNNISFTHEAAGQNALELYGDDYLLRYMLDFETKGSETLLNVRQMSAPFDYKLTLHEDGETRAMPVDLPETFAYLLGLRVKSRKVYYDGERPGRDPRAREPGGGRDLARYTGLGGRGPGARPGVRPAGRTRRGGGRGLRQRRLVHTPGAATGARLQAADARGARQWLRRKRSGWRSACCSTPG